MWIWPFSIPVPLASPEPLTSLPRIFQEEISFEHHYNARITPCIPYQGKVRQCVSCAINIQQETGRICLPKGFQHIVLALGNMIKHAGIASARYEQMTYLLSHWPYYYSLPQQRLPGQHSWHGTATTTVASVPKGPSTLMLLSENRRNIVTLVRMWN